MRLFKPKKDIYRKDGKIYLKRWTLFECKLFSLKIHKILLTDDECLHDHPWNFISIILKGGYVEYRDVIEKVTTVKRYMKIQDIMNKNPEMIKNFTLLDDNTISYTICKTYHPLNVLYRNATDKHRLELHQSCWTFVISLKKTRVWGFWTKFGFIKHYDYDSKQHCD